MNPHPTPLIFFFIPFSLPPKILPQNLKKKFFKNIHVFFFLVPPKKNLLIPHIQEGESNQNKPTHCREGTEVVGVCRHDETLVFVELEGAERAGVVYDKRVVPGTSVVDNELEDSVLIGALQVCGVHLTDLLKVAANVGVEHDVLCLHGVVLLGHEVNPLSLVPIELLNGDGEACVVTDAEHVPVTHLLPVLKLDVVDVAVAEDAVPLHRPLREACEECGVLPPFGVAEHIGRSDEGCARSDSGLDGGDEGDVGSEDLSEDVMVVDVRRLGSGHNRDNKRVVCLETHADSGEVDCLRLGCSGDGGGVDKVVGHDDVRGGAEVVLDEGLCELHTTVDGNRAELVGKDLIRRLAIGGCNHNNVLAAVDEVNQVRSQLVPRGAEHKDVVIVELLVGLENKLLAAADVAHIKEGLKVCEKLAVGLLHVHALQHNHGGLAGKRNLRGEHMCNSSHCSNAGDNTQKDASLHFIAFLLSGLKGFGEREKERERVESA